MNALSSQLMFYALMPVPFAILVAALRSATVKGWLGEMMARLSAQYLLDKNEYRAIHNVTLSTLDGTTQIDHIFVSRFGIFVVETKNYSGWIFGTEHQPTWTQRIYRTSNKFQNPLHQNFKHLKALENALNLPLETFKSVIVFVGGSTFKTEMPANVTYAGGYIRYIKSHTQQVLSTQEVDQVFNAIAAGRLKPSMATNREHVRHLQKRSDPTASRLCPKCGSVLVVRSRKSGDNAGNQFWGCSQYPKCRFTQPLA